MMGDSDSEDSEEPIAGLEPAPHALRMRCSTN